MTGRQAPKESKSAGWAARDARHVDRKKQATDVTLTTTELGEVSVTYGCDESHVSRATD